MPTNYNPTLKTTFLITSALFLILALTLFVFADSIATLPANTRAANPWPWPIGPLALRFVASLLFAGALVSYLVSRRPDPPTLTAFFSVLTVISSMLLLHLAFNIGSIDWSKPLAYVWSAAVVLGFLASAYLALRLRRNAVLTVPPLQRTPAPARNIAIFIFFLTTAVGGIMFLFPDFGRERWPWDLANNTNVQLLGAIFLGVGLNSLLSWLHPGWHGYDLFYAAAGTFALVALIASFMHWNLFAAKPLSSWAFVLLYVIGIIFGFGPYIYYVMRAPRNAQQSAPSP